MLSALPGAMFGEVTAGEGPPIVALHGWGRTHRDFDRFRSLAPLAGRHIVAVDLPGFGATPAPRTAVGARVYAEMLVPLVASLGSPVVFVGTPVAAPLPCVSPVRTPNSCAAWSAPGHRCSVRQRQPNRHCRTVWSERQPRRTSFPQRSSNGAASRAALPITERRPGSCAKCSSPW